MIRGHKPAAYTVTGDGIVKIEGEQRQCVHCQFLWDYVPGSGDIRGYCLRCDGFLCARPACESQQRWMLREFERLSGSTDRHCIPWTDYVNRQRDALEQHPMYKVTQSGIVVPR